MNLKLILWCSLCALIGVVLAKCVFGQALAPTVVTPPSGWYLRPWLTFQQRENAVRIVSEIEPKIQQLPDGRWEIIFVKTP